MRLHRLSIRNFRGTTERTVEFAERGVTVVEGPNEVGKSSLAEALDLLFGYQAHSKAQAVKRVQPLGRDVATEVEAALSCGPYHLTYTKRFNRDHATTLHLHKPSDEQLAGGEAHDRVQAILSEHVDEALWRALRIQQGIALEQADLSSQTSLATALDTAAGARVGGEREAALFERVREEYGRYHTPTGRPNQSLKELAEAEDAARSDVEAAETALREVDDDVALCASLQTALDGLAPQLAEARERADEHERAWRALESRQGEVERLRLATALAAGERTSAANALSERERLAERCTQADEALAALRAESARREPALAAAEEEVATAAERVAYLRDAVDAARADARARDTALEALRDRDALTAIDDRLTRAEAAQAAVTAADDALAGRGDDAIPTVDEDMLEALEEALAQVHGARAAAEAEAPTVTVSRLEPVGLHIDGEAVEAGDAPVSRPVIGALAVRIGDVAEIRVDAGRDAAAHDERVRAAERSLDALLAECGVDDVSAARAAHRRRAAAVEERDRARQALSETLGDETIAELRTQRERCADRLAAVERVDGALPASVEDARAQADEARTAVEHCERDLAAAESALRDAQSQREALVSAGATLRVRLEAAEQAHDEAVAELEAARSDTDDATLRRALRDAEAQHAQAERAHAAAADRLADDDPDGAHAAFEEAASRRDRLAKEQRALEDDLRDARARLAVRGEEGLHDQLAEAQRRLEHAARAHTSATSRATAARLLFEEMATRRHEATRAYAAPLRDKLCALGRIVYGEDFSVDLADDLRIATRSLRGQTLPFEDLSTGAREQLSLLARLSVAALVARDGGVPLLLDDALGWSDPSRLERLGAALRVGARDAQVIVLTCVPDRYRSVTDATVVRLDPGGR